MAAGGGCARILSNGCGWRLCEDSFELLRVAVVHGFSNSGARVLLIDGSVGGGSTQRRGGCNEGGKSPRRLIDSIDRKVVQWLCNGS